MITPQLTGNGQAVRLPLSSRVAALLDDLALSYTADPDAVGALLNAHAARVLRLDFAQVSADVPDHVRAIRAAEADGTREALLDECPSADRLDDVLTPDDAITLGTRLTKHAAHIRHTQTRSPRT
ncbi:hypothetical protein [Streptomyces sp. GQFP]|uniref:hypothetical protein n=1 Tax=Streptomyces sp. GQFP TaxID=2907545 RepID=UPI001F486239|nr:hypothetical protein [Streptomyces sp. GQFP]UIX33575.1 hypothetical protein LUX31_28200 [Streptomyces sp. GQFP]